MIPTGTQGRPAFGSGVPQMSPRFTGTGQPAPGGYAAGPRFASGSSGVRPGAASPGMPRPAGVQFAAPPQPQGFSVVRQSGQAPSVRPGVTMTRSPGVPVPTAGYAAPQPIYGASQLRPATVIQAPAAVEVESTSGAMKASDALEQDKQMLRLQQQLEDQQAMERCARELFDKFGPPAQRVYNQAGQIMLVRPQNGVLSGSRVRAVLEELYKTFGQDPALVATRFRSVLDNAPDMAFPHFLQLYSHILEVLRDYVFPKTKVDRRFIIGEKGTAEDMHKLYEMKEKLGEGAFGTVLRAMNRITNKDCVIKVMHLQAGAPIEQLRQEVDIMRMLDHPHVVRIFQCYEEPGTMHVAMEMVKGKDLMEVLQDAYKGTAFSNQAVAAAEFLNEVWIARVIRQISEAVAYCHSQNIMHKDLKLQNVMVICENGGKPRNPTHCVVLDFGFAEVFSPHRRDYIPSGSPMFCAPEVFRRNFSNKCDVWSIGVMAYSLLTGRFPFEPVPADLPNLQRMLLSPQPANWQPLLAAPVSEDAKRFCQRLIDKNEAQRPHAKACLEDPWFYSKRMTRASIAPQLIGNLMDFQNQSYVLRAVQNIVAAKMDTGDVQVSKINRLFSQLDKDRDGVLTSEEFGTGLKRMGVDEEQVEQMVKALNMNGDGTVTYTNFLAAAVRNSVEDMESVVTAAFDSFDSRKRGRLTLSDFSSMLAGHKDKFQAILPDGATPEDILKRADRTGDGNISKDEFKKFILQEYNASIAEDDEEDDK
mmetsp:Transcript_104006/g.238123  ORF Transcript_104006/g.238123 Transcript_104006/m.238123 type:complete len:757 (+) Transcript_104006:40-2310(+)